MNSKQKTKVGRKLSLILRHNPASIGITLDKNGWVDVGQLITKMNQSGTKLSLTELQDIVATNDKQRYSFDEFGEKIRANQGHSLKEVDLKLPPITPPAILYHGTATRFLDSIFKNGLEKRSRNHVHLSADLGTARKVGSRHGKVVILWVDASAMLTDGHRFYRSENGVWLVESVPSKYLSVHPKEG